MQSSSPAVTYSLLADARPRGRRSTNVHTSRCRKASSWVRRRDEGAPCGEGALGASYSFDDNPARASRVTTENAWTDNRHRLLWPSHLGNQQPRFNKAQLQLPATGEQAAISSAIFGF